MNDRSEFEVSLLATLNNIEESVIAASKPGLTGHQLATHMRDIASSMGSLARLVVAGELAPKVATTKYIRNQTLFDMVREFHEAFGHPHPDKPTLIDPARLAIRRQWADDERAEFDEALANGDLVGCADALADELYFLVGTCVEMGIPIDAVVGAVHAANMAKLQHQEPHNALCAMTAGSGLRCTCGKIAYNEQGKTLKPEGWTGPERFIKAILER